MKIYSKKLFATNNVIVYRINYLILITLAILSSCHKKNTNEIVEFKLNNNTSISSRFSIDKIHTTNIFLKPQNIKGLFTDIAVIDSLLLTGNLRDQKLMNFYSLNSKKVENEIITRGTAKNQGLSASNIIFQNNQPYISWLYDITLSKLFKINLTNLKIDTLKNKEIILGKELKNMIAPNIINDSLILATTYSFSDFRYFQANSQHILKKIGKLSDVINDKQLADNPNTKFPNRAFIFKALSIKRSFENRVAIFYNKTDRIEVYLNEKLIKIIYGQENFGPIEHVSKLKKGYMIEDSDKTRYAFLSVVGNTKYLFALFSGKKNGESISNTVLVFDWNGKLVTKLKLDKYVSKIFVNPKNNILYCYAADKEMQVYSANLNL